MEELSVVTWRVPRASASVVEAAALPEQGRDETLRALRDAAGAQEMVYLPTCQRVLFALLHAPPDAEARLRDAYARLAGRALPPGESFRARDAFRHLAEVASSLDSLVVGEPQVLGQVRAAAAESDARGLSGPGLRHVVSLVLHAAKAVRTDTALFRGKVSLVPLTEGLVAQRLRERPRPRAAVLGTGQIGEKMLELLARHDGVDLHVVSRRRERAAEVASRYGAAPLALDEFLASPPERLDLVALAMPLERPVLDAARLRAMARDHPLLVLDLAVPRNAEPLPEPVEGLQLVQMDDLSRMSGEARRAREDEVGAALALLDRELDRIEEAYEARKLAHDLAQLRERFDEVARERLALHPGAPDEPDFAKWYDQTVRALLHEATAAVKRAGCREGRKP